MNREIKFRAWSERSGMVNIDVLALSECGWSCPDYGKQGVSIPYQPQFKIMQYTGLKDKNGVEIYEGDVFKSCVGNIFKVYWDSDNCCFSVWSLKTRSEKTEKYTLGKYINMVNNAKCSIEIIGNIFEENKTQKP